MAREKEWSNTLASFKKRSCLGADEERAIKEQEKKDGQKKYHSLSSFSVFSRIHLGSTVYIHKCERQQLTEADRPMYLDRYEWIGIDRQIDRYINKLIETESD